MAKKSAKGHVWTCSHGVSSVKQCDQCELVGLKEALKWMAPRVNKMEKRLAELTTQRG